jgi:hypothetical protein
VATVRRTGTDWSAATLFVSGMKGPAIGELAAANSVVLRELSPRAGSLEEAFGATHCRFDGLPHAVEGGLRVGVRLAVGLRHRHARSSCCRALLHHPSLVTRSALAES